MSMDVDTVSMTASPSANRTCSPKFDVPQQTKTESSHPQSLSQPHVPSKADQIHNAVVSNLNCNDSISSVTPVASSVIRRAAPESNKRALYVGGLDQRVTEDIFRQIFETTGHVHNVKIIPDKSSKGSNYGFVEYDDPSAAERALQTLNGRRVHQSEIRVNWAFQSHGSSKADTSGHFHLFIGDLSNEVNDEILMQAFCAFGSVSEARVMWDMKTGRTRGYGFVAFKDRSDAEKALSSMDGEWLGSRPIRCNWANQRGQPSLTHQLTMQTLGTMPTNAPGHHHFPMHGLASYEIILNQTPHWQTNCYVGNLTPYTTPSDIVPLFQNFGYVLESRFQADRGFAFIKMNSHENAAMAICHTNGYNVNGRPLKCSWGKDKIPLDYASAEPSPLLHPNGVQPHIAFSSTTTNYPSNGSTAYCRESVRNGQQVAQSACYNADTITYDVINNSGRFSSHTQQMIDTECNRNRARHSLSYDYRRLH